MIYSKMPKSIGHNDDKRTLKWPYGSQASSAWASPNPIMRECWESNWPAFGASGTVLGPTLGYRLFSAMREVAWQAINTNTYPERWADISEIDRNKWDMFAEELLSGFLKESLS